ncbi:hypothetical protein ACGFSI_29625 [Streptomyces virginiae]|uniref:hypothetical protein n=1 Tax=Streptomyces virginiae TaxID=1961 RepID=UPI003710D7D4
MREGTIEPEPPPEIQTSHHSLDRYRFILEISATLVGLLTLAFLALQTVATREQAEEAANQVAAARPDGLYQQLLNYDEFRSSTENKHLNLLWATVAEFDEIEDPEEREQVYSLTVWFIDYFDYVYTTLPGLLKCVPKDGHLVLRGSSEDTGKCDEWVAWSQTIFEGFNDVLTCQVLNESVQLYEKKFVAAIRKSHACSTAGPTGSTG